MTDTQDMLLLDMQAVKRIPIVSSMLEVLSQTTGMGFVTIARVTRDRWLACSVLDTVEFGLKEGGELAVETTLCNEIRDHHKPIIIDNVSEDAYFQNHHTPKMYGLQSYISYPIILQNGEFFGTLCAIDAKPAKINETKIIETFRLFAELLSFHLQSVETLHRVQVYNAELNGKYEALTNINNDLDNFVYTASHDLKSPIANMEGLINVLQDVVARENLDRKEIHHLIGLIKMSVDRFSITIKDLTTIARVQQAGEEEETETLNIYDIVEYVKEDIKDLLITSGGEIEVVCIGKSTLSYSRKNLISILYNLLSNAIKYRAPNRTPKVEVKLDSKDSKTTLTVTDNGLGIPGDKKDSVFTLFKRFHDHVEGTGIGLYIVKKLITNSKGQIHVESSLGAGTKFILTFNT